MDPVLLESLSDGVLTLTMHRPESRNALNAEMIDALLHATRRAASDPAVRAVVLTGAGPAFCSGGDVKAMAAGTASLTIDQRTRQLRERMETSRLLHEMPKPTLAVIRGAAAGAGLSLALACDLRVATPGAKLTTAFSKVALSGDFGGSYFLPRVVGPAKARELYLLSPVLSGTQALAIGLVNQLMDDDAIEAQAWALAVALANGPTVTYGHIKNNFNLAEHADLAAVFDSEAIRHIQCSTTADHREAAAAFVAKRAPRFTGA